MAASQLDWCAVTPVGDLLVRAAALAPDRIGLAMPDEVHTYGALMDGALAVARGLTALGIESGQNVGLLAPNSVEYVEAFFGAAMIGAVLVPLNVRHRAVELRYITDHAQLACILTTARVDDYVELSKILREALPSLSDSPDAEALQLPETPNLRSIVVLRGTSKPGMVSQTRFDELARTRSDAEVHRARRTVRIRDTAIILYTSGTTANPKGCMLTHEALTRGPVNRASGRFSSGAESEVYWIPGPLFHVGALSPWMGCVGAAGTCVTDVYFDPGRAIELMSRYAITSGWPWFAAVTAAILDHPDFDPKLLDRMQFLGQIGPRSLFERIRDRLPWTEIFKSSGMTEAAGSFGLSTANETFEQRVVCQGEPIPGVEVRIIDPETGEDQPRGEMGELLLRGFCITEGYFREPEITARTLSEERWLRTGDLYSHLPDGKLVFHGRFKDMLKVGGENVATLEIEDFICGHPDVRAAEVVGKPDERLDEVPVVFVELRTGATLGAAELIEFCVGQIASYKVPRAVHFVEPGSWPMSATKVDKRELRRRLAELEPATL